MALGTAPTCGIRSGGSLDSLGGFAIGNLVYLVTIAVITVIVAAVLVVLVGSIWLDWKLFDFFMDLGAGKGPLDIQAAADGKRVMLTVLNRGKKGIRLVAVEGRDTGERRVFPTPSLDTGEIVTAMDKADRVKQLARVVLGPGESRTVMLDRDELVALNCRALGIRAGGARLWTADGFDALGIEESS